MGENIKEYKTCDEKKTITMGAMISADGAVKFPIIIDKNAPWGFDQEHRLEQFDGFRIKVKRKNHKLDE